MGISIDKSVLLKHCATGELLMASAVIGNPFFTTGVRSPNSSDVGRRGEYGGIMSYVISATNKCHPQQHLGSPYGHQLLVLGEKYDLLQVWPTTAGHIGVTNRPKIVLKTAPSCGRSLPQTPTSPMARKGRGLSSIRMNRYKRFRG
jgi:hypothetical protein